MNNTAIIVIIVLVLGFGLVVLYTNNANNTMVTDSAVPSGTVGTEPAPKTPNTPATTTRPTATTTTATSTATSTADTLMSYTVHSSNFKYLPANLTAKKGQTVRITFVNDAGTHDWNLDDFNAHTKQIGAGKTETIEFVASKAGSFEYYCSVGNHRAMGMVGTLTVSQ